ncbi:MAG: 3-dehydroquinate synthase [Kiritimatiellae bacterium]|nr:3-dehydroquinate synthase [Kiritimatiellia bacterium]
MKTIVEKVAVSFSYPVVFTRSVFDPDNRTLLDTLTKKYATSQKSRALVVVDAGLAKATKGLLQQIEVYFGTHAKRLSLVHPPVTVTGGEATKTGFDELRKVIDLVQETHLDRHGFVVVVGGGAVQDMAGFAASIAHRGLRIVRIPTTVLSQDDAGVGVKNGMDYEGCKNFLGTFAPPFAVINDSEFLKTLNDEAWISGVAEAFKVAIIKDKAFFIGLCKHAAAIRKRDLAVMEQVVYRTAELHLKHIMTSGDPFETGSARPLDFGHWAAHRMESMSGYRLTHGFAVSVGICLDSTYAFLKGLISDEERQAILKGMAECGLPVWSPLLERKDKDGKLVILAGLDQFREHLGGDLCVTLPAPVGARLELHSMDHAVIEEAIAMLKPKSGKRKSK